MRSPPRPRAGSTTLRAPAAIDPAAVPAAEPGEATPAATSPAATAPVDDDQAVGLRQTHECLLADITVAALRWARANDPTFPAPAGKRGAELLYRAGDLKKWARNRPRAASGTTDLD
ncbi:hypothetical protein [Streptomyces stackebrandtii]|uniref:hypothetical protein n=1 Tax=Streptomyces stackebrandtii TaxID=3051177 RepID=UPI0028DB5C9D|nr:hypothetical protein [Streptomyces sp. DSM 40976]